MNTHQVAASKEQLAGSIRHHHDCHGHLHDDHHKYRNQYHYDLTARRFFPALPSLSPLELHLWCFSAYKRAMASGAASTRGASQLATGASPTGGASQAPRGAPLVEHAQEPRRRPPRDTPPMAKPLAASLECSQERAMEATCFRCEERCRSRTSRCYYCQRPFCSKICVQYHERRCRVEPDDSVPSSTLQGAAAHARRFGAT